MSASAISSVERFGAMAPVNFQFGPSWPSCLLSPGMLSAVKSPREAWHDWGVFFCAVFTIGWPNSKKGKDGII